MLTLFYIATQTFSSKDDSFEYLDTQLCRHSRQILLLLKIILHNSEQLLQFYHTFLCMFLSYL